MTDLNCCVCDKEITEKQLFDTVVWVGDTEYFHDSCAKDLVHKHLWATRIGKGKDKPTDYEKKRFSEKPKGDL